MHSKKEKKAKAHGQINEGLNGCTLIGSVHKRMQKKLDIACQEAVIF